MNFNSKIALSGACFGLMALFAAQVPATAQDQAPGHNDNDVRKTEVEVKKGPRPNKNTKKDGPNIETVLLFPPDTPSPAGMADQLTDTVTRVEQRRLNASKRYQSVYFTRAVPVIRRAVNDGTLTPADTDRPFNPLKAKKISQLSGYANIFMTDINGYSYDADKHQVTLSISLSLIDYSGSKPVVRSAGEQMVSSDKEPKSATEITIALDVARDLTEKLMTELFKPKTTAPAAPSDAADKTDKTDKTDGDATDKTAKPDKPNPAK